MRTKLAFLILAILLSYETFAQISITYSLTVPYCYGDTTGQINVSVSGGMTPYLYEWSNGATTQDLNNLGAGTYVLTVTDMLFNDETVSIVLTQPDSLEVFTFADQTICLGQPAQLVANAMGGSTPYTYFWNPGGMGSSYIVVTPTVSTEYCVYVKDSHNCISNMACATVFVYPPIEVLATVSDDTICEGDSVLIDVQVSGGTGGPYLVEVDNVQVETPLFLSPAVSTTYLIEAFDYCGSPCNTCLITVYVASYPAENISANFSGASPIEATFTYTTTGPSACTVDFGDGVSDYFSASPYLHEYANTGIFNVQFVFDPGVCFDTLNAIVDLNGNSFSTLEIADALAVSENSTQIHPNPVSSEINLSFFNAGNDIISISILNSQGVFVDRIVVHEESDGYCSIPLNAVSYPNGMYICHVCLGKQVFTKKFVVER